MENKRLRAFQVPCRADVECPKETRMEFPANLRYTRDHAWARREGTRVVVGMTDYAQKELGDVVFVELPEVGATVAVMDVLGVVESVKAVSDLYAPMSGTVVESNLVLEDQPELVNASPYGQGWLAVLEATNAAEWDDLLNASDYQTHVAEEQASR